jgi:hypothetical protein
MPRLVHRPFRHESATLARHDVSGTRTPRACSREMLVTVAWLTVTLGIASALVVAVHVATHTQRAWIMNVVWPLTALWSGPLGLGAYFAFGRANRAKPQPFPIAVAKGTTHCGSGCTLGDIVAAIVFVALPVSLFGRELFGSWLYEYIAAFAFGILFQYFASHHGLKDAVKADALSLTAWQIGMYGWMAIATFVLLRRELSPKTVVFWFMMQIGMLAGFLTSYPVNWWLLRRGVKEAM